MIPYPQAYKLTVTDQHIWRVAQTHAVQRLVMGQQTFLFLPREAFHAISNSFQAEPLRHGHWRSRCNDTHLHAVDEGDFINVHLDGANPYGGLWSLFKHVYIDVIGTALPTLATYRRIALRPSHNDLEASVPSVRLCPGY